MEYEKLTYFGFPTYDLFDFERQNGMVTLKLFLKLSGWNTMSSSKWLEIFGRISGNMKILYILLGTPYSVVLHNLPCVRMVNFVSVFVFNVGI